MVKIKSIGEVVADGHGHFTVDLELSDGIKGYYPNTLEFLNKLTAGATIEYLGVKEFAGRTKINGLVLKEKIKKMSKINALIASTSELQKGDNGSYFKEITTEDGISAIHFSKEISEVESLIAGSLISYSDVKNMKGKDIFVNLEKGRRYSTDDKRQLSIMRQSSIKAAIECIGIASPKGRWIDKEGNVDINKCFDEVILLSEKFIEYVTVE